MLQQRVHVYLSKQGVGSRREIESWITSGYIQINGKPAKLGQKIDPDADQIRIRGKTLSFPKVRAISVLAINKPRGIITTVKDPEGRPTVMDMVPKNMRLFPVGRLDLMSEGLLLMTNDGDLALQLTHPKFEVPKVYEVKIRGNLDQKKITHLKKGVSTPEGKFKGAEVLSVHDVTREGVKKFNVVIKVFEGKNHHVRKMFDSINCRVIRLKRIEMGSVSLKGIPRGGFRVLSRSEVEKLRLPVKP